MTLRTLGVTGTRGPRGGFRTDELQLIESTFVDAFWRWLNQGFSRREISIVQGGCLGVDEYLAWIAHDAGLHVVTVLSDDRSRTSPLREGFTDELVEVHVERPSGRNLTIVERATRMLAFPLYEERDQPYSGTWHCIRRALAAGKLAPSDLHILRPTHSRSQAPSGPRTSNPALSSPPQEGPPRPSLGPSKSRPLGPSQV